MSLEPEPAEAQYQRRRRQRQQAAAARAEPKRIDRVVADLMAKRGYGQAQAAESVARAWRQVAGALAGEHTRVGPIRQGVLEVIVGNSVMIHELTFRKDHLVGQLRELLGDAVRDVRFRAGAVSKTDSGE